MVSYSSGTHIFLHPSGSLLESMFSKQPFTSFSFLCMFSLGNPIYILPFSKSSLSHSDWPFSPQLQSPFSLPFRQFHSDGPQTLQARPDQTFIIGSSSCVRCFYSRHHHHPSSHSSMEPPWPLVYPSMLFSAFCFSFHLARSLLIWSVRNQRNSRSFFANTGML